MQEIIANQAPTTISLSALPVRLLSLINDNDIDWQGNCIFKDNKVVGFKTDMLGNHYRMRPVPRDNPAAVRDAKIGLAILEKMLMPVTSEQLGLILKKLWLHCGVQSRTPDEINSMFYDYFSDLGRYPAKLIADACESYRLLPADNSFMPSSGKLISIMDVRHRKMVMMRQRLRIILGLETPVPPKKRKNETRSFCDVVKEMV